jgi:hypothetical protein
MRVDLLSTESGQEKAGITDNPGEEDAKDSECCG